MQHPAHPEIRRLNVVRQNVGKNWSNASKNSRIATSLYRKFGKYMPRDKTGDVDGRVF